MGKPAASTELEMSRCIAQKNPKSEGSRYLRMVSNSFEVAGPDSTYLGLVYAPGRQKLHVRGTDLIRSLQI